MQVNIKNFVFIEDAEVTFSNGFTVVKGVNKSSSGNSSNGSGKTLFLEAILWAIWGQSIRRSAQADLIGPHDTSMSVEVILPNITIRRSRKSSGVSLEVEHLGEVIKYQKVDQGQEFINSVLDIDYEKAKLFVYYGEYSDHLLEMGSAQRRDAVVKLVDYHEESHVDLADRIKERLRVLPVEENSAQHSADAELRLIQVRVSHIEEKHNAAVSKSEALKESLSALIKEIAESSEPESTKTDEEYSNEIKDLEQVQENFELKVSELEKTKSDLYAEVNALRSAKSDALKEANEQATQYASKNSMRNTDSLLELEKELEVSKEAGSVIASEVEEARSAYNSISLETKEISSLIDSIKKEIVKNDREIESRSRTTSDVCHTCSQTIEDKELIAKLEETLNAHKAEKSSLEQKLKVETAKLEQVSSSVDGAKQKLEDAQERLVKARDAYKALKATYNASKREEESAFEARFNSVFKGRLEALTAPIEEQYSMIGAKEIEIGNAESLIADHKDILSKNKRDIQYLVQSQRQAEAARKAYEGLFDKRRLIESQIADSESDIESILEEQAASFSELETKKEVVNKELISKLSALEAETQALKSLQSMLSSYKHHTVTRFVQTFEERLNAYLSKINSDIRCKISDKDGTIDFLFSDSSKDGKFYPYHVASRGERTRIKKTFLQVLIEMFLPPFVLSDESYDGLDEEGMKALSAFTLENNSNRFFIEASPLDLELEADTTIITVEKEDLVIRVING